METRKVQQVGGGTYTVSIPVHWANEHEVGAGDTAYLYPHSDGSLVVRWADGQDSEVAATVVDLADSEGEPATPAAAEHSLDAAYVAGYRRIEVRAAGGLDDAQRRAVVDRTRTLSGVSVTEETEDSVTVRGLLDAGDVSIRQSVSQLRFTAVSMHDAAVDRLSAAATADGGAGDEQPARVRDRVAEADRLARLVERYASRAMADRQALDDLGLSRARLTEYATAARQLEQVAEHAVAVARHAADVRSPAPADAAAALRTVGDDARRVVEDATGALANGGGPGAAHSARRLAATVESDARDVQRALVEESPPGAPCLLQTLNCLTETAACGAAIATAALRASVRS